ncbi:CHAT domain-containing protein [Chloroflexi bacterium TSY]|nr:CHAT domain-containing protein [Chloroflexi bacterium TSY]
MYQKCKPNSEPPPEIAYQCHYGIGRVRYKQNQVEQAVMHQRQAIKELEYVQASIGAEDYKIAFRSDKLQVYEEHTLLCLELNTTAFLNEAFETAERAKSRTLLDALVRQPGKETHNRIATKLLSQMEQVKRELNWYYNRLYTAEPEIVERTADQINELTSEVAKREKILGELLNEWRSPELISAPQNPINVATIKQIQLSLSSDSIIIEYFIACEKIVIFCVSQDSAWTHYLPTSLDEIAHALTDLRFQLNKFNYGPEYWKRHQVLLLRGMESCLHRLYELLLEPFSKELKHNRLIIIPHGIIHYIPFHALYDGNSYLIENQSVSYAPSATFLQRVLKSHASESANPPVLIGLADESIPHTYSEVKTITELFPGASMYVGEDAQLTSLSSLSHHPAFLHLATHAMFRADNPLFSALKFSDGWLNLNDLQELHNSTPLVTLSACETGRNQIGIGDELIGLCRGFFGAGAQSLVVSLWTVDDESTTQFMIHFYRELKAGQPVYRALHAAQLAIMSTYKHPYHWAPFILTGNPHFVLPFSAQ